MVFLPLSILLQSTNGVILGIDWGDRRIGLSTSDLNQKLAFPLTVLKRSRSLKNDLKALARLTQERSCVAFVWGWPIHLSGEVGVQCQKVLEAALALQTFVQIPFFQWDERLSTVAASKLLRSLPISRTQQRTSIDCQSATFILQGTLDWLQVHRNQSTNFE